VIFIFQVEEFLVEAVNKDVQLDAGDYFKVTFFNKNYRKLICLDGGKNKSTIKRRLYYLF